MRAHYGRDKRQYGEMSYESKYLLDPKYMTKRDIQYYYRYYNLTKNRSQFKKVIVIVFCICFFSYIFVDYNLKTKLIRLKDRFDFIPRMDADYNITQAYFVNQPGCRMPYFNVTDENIIQFMNRPQNFSCKKPLIRSSDMGSELLLNMDDAELQDHFNVSSLSSINCKYTEIKRRDDQHNDYGKSIEFKLEYNTTVLIKASTEFVGVECYTPDSRLIYKDFHFFAINKRTTKMPTSSTIYERIKLNKHMPYKSSSTHNSHSYSSQRTHGNDNVPRISVLLLGIDSVSHLNFLRQMPHSAAYIHHNLSHVEFWGYNKLGDNTYPNLVPVLSGLDETELNISCLAPVKQANFDKCAFIWRRYEEAGYKTVYAEDVATLGLFNFFRPGFKQQPTDYYLRPIMLEMEKYISYKRSVNVDLCKGGRRTVDVVLEYIRKLIPLFRKQDFFSFFWTVTLTHDLLNMPILFDHDIRQLLEAFDRSSIFNKTVVFLMSDHGLRWGSFRKTYQGMMEERQPLLIMIYPKWFKESYPQAISNLESNAKRLTTHFDVHATMLELLNLGNLRTEKLTVRANELADMETMPRGISLFLPIPVARTCELAGIASHWCTCHQREELQTNDPRVQRAARYIVKLINGRLKPFPQCRSLYLNSILEAIIAAPHHKIIKEVTNDYGIDITVRIQTKPGLGVFESTVRMSTYSTELTGTISRLNLYASQSYCIDDYALKMFCYCHR